MAARNLPEGGAWRKVRPVPDPLDRTIVHFALNDPREVRGGVETFGRTLGRFFREVVPPATLDVARIRAERLMDCEELLGQGARRPSRRTT
jgi:hypothetical protein